MFKTFKDFYVFCRYATYSPVAITLFWLSLTSVFSVFQLVANTSDYAIIAAYVGFCFAVYAAQYIVGYIVYRYLRNIAYYEAMDRFRANYDREADITLYNWIELFGIIARKVRSFKTLQSPEKVNPFDFFNIRGLPALDQYAKLQTYREIIEERSWLYPRSQHNIYRLQRMLAEQLMHEERMREWHKKHKQKAANNENTSTKQAYWRNILGIAENATLAEAKKAYRKLAMKHHPDRGGEKAKFQEIQSAWQNAQAYYS